MMIALPCALGLERPAAVFRQRPEDFVVHEELGFELTGEGEHLWLEVEKTGVNTVDVARQLARLAGIRERDVGYAGLKDRHAVARQWFSVPVSADVALTAPETAGWRIRRQVRNSRKLRRGSHRGNRFAITLREIAVTPEALMTWQQTLMRTGCPNYFGLQRFGHHGSNLDKADALFNGGLKASRHQRGLYLSAARSWLFNRVLATRVDSGTWNTCLPGDVMALAGSGSVFRAEASDSCLGERLASGDIHPTGPLWGAGELMTTGEAALIEAGIAAELNAFSAGLARAGLAQERRALRLMPMDLTVTGQSENQVSVAFSLPRGAYATSVLREMVRAEGL